MERHSARPRGQPGPAPVQSLKFMTDPSGNSPAARAANNITDWGRQRQVDREAKRAEALRANLRRRKEQQRGWADRDGATPTSEDESSNKDGK